MWILCGDWERGWAIERRVAVCLHLRNLGLDGQFFQVNPVRYASNQHLRFDDFPYQISSEFSVLRGFLQQLWLSGLVPCVAHG
jgi:hypothetical protein